MVLQLQIHLPTRIRQPSSSPKLSNQEDKHKAAKIRVHKTKSKTKKEWVIGPAKGASTTTTLSEMYATCATWATSRATRCFTANSRIEWRPHNQLSLHTSHHTTHHNSNLVGNNTKNSTTSWACLNRQLQRLMWSQSSSWAYYPKLLNHSSLRTYAKSRIQENGHSSKPCPLMRTVDILPRTVRMASILLSNSNYLMVTINDHE